MATSPKKKDLKHVMISYQWDSQKRMIKLREKLKKEGYNVWMDVEKMEGKLLTSMAEAVENAGAVLICISKKYQESRNCETEAQYAFSKDKLIIPLIFEKDYNPTSWLGPLVTTRLYYRVDTDEMLDQCFPDLIRALGNIGRKPRAEAELPAKGGKSKALQCSICLDRFKTPKTLPCLHSFCKECLLGWAPRGTRTVSCPQCREKSNVPNGDVTQFRTNFHLKELVEEEAMRQQFGGRSDFTCTCCENRSRVVAKCDKCNHYLCTSGLSGHRRFDDLRGHRVVVFKMNTEEATDPTVKCIAKSKPELELKANDWAIFDALYDEVHSMDLFRYWMQQHGKDSRWQETMVDHYLAGLTDLEECGLLSEDLLAKRQRRVAIVADQAGQYDKALKLLEKTLDMEIKELGERPENMAGLYFDATCIYAGKLDCVTLIKDLDPELIQKQMKYARQSLKLRRKLKGDDNKFEVARALRLLSGALYRWTELGGDSVLSAEDAKSEGMKYIDESIEIFKQLNAKGNAAKSIGNKANLEERGSEEREKLFREALAMSDEAYGEYCVSSGDTHYNMCILYQDRDDYYEAYNWLVKCRNIYEKVYGRHHPQMQRVYDKLEWDEYVDVKKNLEAKK